MTVEEDGAGGSSRYQDSAYYFCRWTKEFDSKRATTPA